MLAEAPCRCYNDCMTSKGPMSYVPHLSYIPHLQIPENRVMYAFDWYSKNHEHPNNFACYSYWIQQCTNDGSDY